MTHQERNPYANIRRQGDRCKRIDMHEIAKREIYTQGFEDTNFRFGFNAPQLMSATGGGTITPAPPGSAEGGGVVGFEDTELYFDSTQRDTSSDYTTGQIKWSVTSLNNSFEIKRCVAMRISEFYFPKIYPATGKPEYFYFLRLFVEFQSAPSTQAVLGPNNNKFHFEFAVDDLTGQAVLMRPLRKGVFYFQRPILSITDYDLCFKVPPTTGSSVASTFKKIQLPRDTVQIVSTLNGGVGYNPIRFQISGGVLTNVLGPIGSTGSPGLAVFITGYNSNSGAVNAAVNSTDGVFVTNIIDTTTFEVGGIDATSVTGQFAATMYIPKNRIAFTVRFTTIKDTFTNYLDVGHD